MVVAGSIGGVIDDRARGAGTREGRAAAARRVKGCHKAASLASRRFQRDRRDQPPMTPSFNPVSSGCLSHVPPLPKYLAVAYDKIITRLEQGVLTPGGGRPRRRLKSCWPRAGGGRHAGQVTPPAPPRSTWRNQLTFVRP